MANYVKFQRGTQAAYDALKTALKLDNNTLYFIYPEEGSSTGALYMGSRVISGGDTIVTSASLDDLADVVVKGAGTNSFLVKENDKWVAKELADVINLIKDNLGTVASVAQVFQGEQGADESAEDAITRLVGDKTVNDGDNAILKKAIANDKYEYTAYVYINKAWAAMDGNYSADNVYFDSNLILTASVGAQEVPSSGSKTLETTGKNIKQVMEMLFAGRKLPEKILPEMTLVSAESKSYEVGTSIAPKYSASLSAGSYTYGPATGIAASSWSVALGEETLDTADGTFSTVKVADDTDLTITATVNYRDGAVPVDNFGNAITDSIELNSCQIKAGSITKKGTSIKGFRKVFFGAKTAPVELISANIRALGGQDENLESVEVTIPSGAKQVVVAVPAGKAIAAIKDMNVLGMDISSVFEKSTVSIGGADATAEDIGEFAKDYDVYVYSPVTALGADKYVVTFVNE